MGDPVIRVLGVVTGSAGGRLALALFCHLVTLSPCHLVSLYGAEPTYWGEVRAVLRKHCTVCHNPRQAKEPEVSGGLRLDTYEAVLRWKEKNKDLIKPGKSAGSLLRQVVTPPDSEKRMPRGVKPLPAETIALLRRWVDGGAREGVRPKDAGTAAAVIPTRRRRKLDVTLATTLVPDRS